ncbi:MAG: type I restriction endonuclease subunit M, partial [Verrucomicrobiota bacterium]
DKNLLSARPPVLSAARVMVSVAEIADPKNDFNLNLPRYIDSTEPEDLQDIDGHLRGGIPDRDLDALGNYWKIMPAIRAALFKPLRSGYSALRIPHSALKPAIFSHPEFTAFTTKARKLFTKWQTAAVPQLKDFAQDGHPKPLIETIAEDLLATFNTAPLLDAYDLYQHLTDYWAETMQDDCYLIADAGWKAGAQPREIRQVKNKENKLVWPEKEDFKKGKRRFKSDLVPATLLIARYFAAERDAIAALEAELAGLEQQLDELKEEHTAEGGLLFEALDDNNKLTKASAAACLKELFSDTSAASDSSEELALLKQYLTLLDQQADAKARLKTAQDDLEAKLDAKYPALTEDEIKTLVVDDKWLATIAAAVQGELDRVSQTLTGRIRQLAERYAIPLPGLESEVDKLASKVAGHLKKMGFKP